MADKRIDQLTYRNDVESTDKLHLNKSGQDYQTNLSDIIPVVITSTLQVEDTDVSLAARNDLSAGATVLTKGDTAVNDGYGGLYVVAAGVVSGTRNITLANGNTAVYQFRSIIENVLNKTSLKSADLPINTIIKTRGLNSQNDGLNGNYIILSAGAYGGTPDEVVDFELDNGNVAKLLDLNVRTLRISNDVIWMTGTGSPEGVTSAAQGSIFSRTDGAIGTTVYIKEVGSGNTGWSAVGGTSIGVEEFTFDTVADMTAATVPVGGICKTNGYYTVGDGGGASYIVMTSGAYPYGTADETIDHSVSLVGGGTGVARQIVNNILTASQCGVQVGTNSTTEVQNMVDYGALSSGGTIVFNQGGDVILNQINIPEVPLIFEGNSRLYLADNANSSIINCPLSEYFVIKNLSIQGNKANNGPISDVALIEVGGGNDFTIQNCLIDGSASIGVRFKDVSGAYVLDSRISGTENGSGIEICNATIECKITGNLITAIVGGSCITITSDDAADKATFVDVSNNTLAGYGTSHYGIYIDNTLSTPSNCTFTDNFILAPNSTNDIHIDNTTPISDGLVFHNNQISESGVTKTHESVNSASTINLKPTYTDWLILGSTAINTITPMDDTQKVYNFEFATTCNVNHNTGNILLKGGDTYLATAGDRLSLYWDGTNFREVARSGALNTLYSASSKQFDPADAWNTASMQFQQVGGTTGQNNYGSGVTLSRIGTSRAMGAIASKQTTADADQGGLAFFGHASIGSNSVLQELGYWNHNRDFVSNGEVYALNTAGGSAYLHVDTGDASDTGVWIKENGTNRFRLENNASGNYFGIYNYGTTSYSMAISYSGNVGLGTSTTTYRLTVEDDSTNWASRIYNSNSNGFGLYVRGGASDGSTEAFRVQNITGVNLFNVMGDGLAGLGTNTPDSELHVRGTNAALKLQKTGSSSYLNFTQPLSVMAAINHENAAGNSILDLNPKPTNGVGDGKVRMFRDTNTTGVRSLDLHHGDGTAGISVRLGVDGEDSYFASGDVGIGTTENPLARLQVQKDGVGAELFRLRSNLGASGNRSAWIESPDTDSLSAPFRFDTNNSWAFSVDGTDRLTVDEVGNIVISAGVEFGSSTIATLPSAAGSTKQIWWATDQVTGAQYVVSNGTNWVLLAEPSTTASDS